MLLLQSSEMMVGTFSNQDGNANQNVVFYCGTFFFLDNEHLRWINFITKIQIWKTAR